MLTAGLWRRNPSSLYGGEVEQLTHWSEILRLQENRRCAPDSPRFWGLEGSDEMKRPEKRAEG